MDNLNDVSDLSDSGHQNHNRENWQTDFAPFIQPSIIGEIGILDLSH